MTCGEAFPLQYQIPSDSSVCYGVRSFSWLCGCFGGHYAYFNAYTVSKQAVLAWVPRVSAFFSILGSSYIFVDVIRDKKKRRSTFHQIILAISIADFFSSFGWGLSTLPIPVVDKFGLPSNVYGARGNRATCAMQGFLVQLGYTSVFYNLSLALYYVFVIVAGWKERQLGKIRMWFHFPLVVGVGLAIAGVPFYDSVIWGCYIPPPPFSSSRIKSLVFGVIPIIFVIVGATTAMAVVVWKVRKDSIASMRWRQPGARRQTGAMVLQREVVWQAVFYLSAFYISFPVLISANLRTAARGFAFWVVMLAFAPLQGLSNFLVYIRPRIVRYLRSKQRERARARNRDNNNGNGGDDDSQSAWSIRPMLRRLNRMIRALWSKNQDPTERTPEFRESKASTRASRDSAMVESTPGSQQDNVESGVDEDYVDPELVIEENDSG
mmetsp:Transcript_7280/g.16536  ORF Transcript_7280/g.16536 Transcript_7280/m.16536 type:complete len:436 (-) Transcript_7280:712-2019(-)